MPERLSRELRLFYELAREASGLDVAEVSERICRELRIAFGFERALFARYDAGRDGVRAVVQQGVDWPGDEWLLLRRFPLLERAREAHRAVFSRDPRGGLDPRRDP